MVNEYLSPTARIDIINKERSLRSEENMTTRKKRMHTVRMQNAIYFAKSHPDTQSQEQVTSLTAINTADIADDSCPKALRFEAAALLIQARLYGDYYKTPELITCFHSNPFADVLLVKECEGETFNAILTKVIEQRLLEVTELYQQLDVATVYNRLKYDERGTHVIDNCLDRHSCLFGMDFASIVTEQVEHARSFSSLKIDQVYCEFLTNNLSINKVMHSELSTEAEKKEMLETLIGLVILDVLKNGQLFWLDGEETKSFNIHRLIEMQFPALVTMDADFYGCAGSNIIIMPSGGVSLSNICKIDSGQSQLHCLEAREKYQAPCHPLLSEYGLTRYASVNALLMASQRPRNHIYGLVLACLHTDEEMEGAIRDSCSELLEYDDEQKTSSALSQEEVDTIVSNTLYQRGQLLETLYKELRYAPHLLTLPFHQNQTIEKFLQQHAKGREVLDRLGSISLLQKHFSPRIQASHQHQHDTEYFAATLEMNLNINKLIKRMESIIKELGHEDFNDNPFALTLKTHFPPLIEIIRQAQQDANLNKQGVTSLLKSHAEFVKVSHLVSSSHRLLNNLCVVNMDKHSRLGYIKLFETEMKNLDLKPKTRSGVANFIAALTRGFRMFCVNTFGLERFGCFAKNAKTRSLLVSEQCRKRCDTHINLPGHQLIAITA